MCKLVLIPSIPERNSKKAWQFAKMITGPMVAHDNDGFGYCAIDSKDRLFAEKWLLVEDAWSNQLPGEFTGLEGALCGGLDDEVYKHYGVSECTNRPRIKSLLLHARFSTCGGGVENSHPHVLSDSTGPWAALVHNGIVDTKGLKLEQSTCDSEGILTKLRDSHAFHEPENLQSALDDIRGYYALGVLAQTYEDGWIVDVVRDGTAELSACWVQELGAVVYATSPRHVAEACKKLRWRKPRTAKVRPCTRVRYAVNTGKVLLVDKFKPAPRWTSYTRHYEGQYTRGDSMTTKEDWEAWRRNWDKEDADDDKKMAVAGGAAATTALEKANTYIGEAADVQRALAAAENKPAEDFVIDPTTGAINLPDGTIIQIAADEIGADGE